MEKTEILDTEKQEQENERLAELEALKAKARADELARVRAEAELEATKRFTTQNQTQTPQVQQWTDENWKQAEEQTGLTRQQLMASQAIASQQVSAASKALEDRIKAAEERAAKAEERASRSESNRGYDDQVEGLLDQKPELKAHKSEVKKFLDKFPESERRDPAKFKELSEMAETYVRGKIKTMRTQGSGSSAKLSHDSGEEPEESQSLNLSDLDNKHQRRLVEDIFEEVESRQDKGDISKFLSGDKTTIRISAEEEWNAPVGKK